MLDPPLEYCSLQFAEYWFKIDRHLVAGLASEDRSIRLATLQRAATAFGVARTLPKAHDEDRGKLRLSPALTILEQFTGHAVAPEDTKMVVHRMANRLGAAYGGRAVLSAATKFLWLRQPPAFVIYDSLARKALGTRNGDYDTYIDRWLEGYGQARDDIARVCKELPRLRLYLSCGRALSDREVHGAASQEWFWKRVYDIYLWRRGSALPSAP